MSENKQIKRYDNISDGFDFSDMEECEDGEYVKYDDYIASQKTLSPKVLKVIKWVVAIGCERCPVDRSSCHVTNCMKQRAEKLLKESK